jgi:hypothetical protein
MVMKPAVIPERVFYHDHPHDAVIEAQSRLKRDAKEHLQALDGTVVKREAGNYLLLRHSLLIRLPSFVLYLRSNR